MEESPAMAVPDTEQEQDFIIPQDHQEEPVAETPSQPAEPTEPEFDLSDITAAPKEKSREEIIAEAEAAAFAEE